MPFDFSNLSPTPPFEPPAPGQADADNARVDYGPERIAVTLTYHSSAADDAFNLIDHLAANGSVDSIDHVVARDAITRAVRYREPCDAWSVNGTYVTVDTVERL